MNNRIKAIREDASLTQQAFANRLNVAKSAVVKWEGGARTVKGATLKAICAEFGINEEWLRTGDGEMHAGKSIYDEIGEFFGKLSDEPPNAFKVQLMRVLAGIPPEHWDVLEDIARRLYQEAVENGDITKD